MYCFKDTKQMSELTTYEFKLPKYGKSTTDPTYYEPSATRIANMRKSAAAGKSLYDFTGEEFADEEGNIDWSKQNISNVHITPGRKPGMTQEEISQNLNDAQNELETKVFARQEEEAQTQADIKKAKTIIKSANENGTEGKSE